MLEGPLAIAAAGEPTDAEYAIRWNTRDGGPKSGAEVLAVLSVHARHTSDYRIDYYGLPPAATAPPGFATILRRRTENAGRSALTWKLRGDHALAEWACPLRKSRNAKAEVDVAFGGADTVTRKYSYSCTTDSPDVAASELSAERKACTSMVRRWDAGRLKVEEWRLPGDVLMIEVSGGGTNTPAATEQFRKRVAVPLLAAGIVPLVDSKTELGSRCP